jgi:DNA-binding NtrC family response regulator
MRPSIFYLDDDPSQLELFSEMFRREYDVRTSTDLSEALRMLAACSADIIISDEVMPGVRGTEFLMAAAQLCPDAVRVLLSGQLLLGEALPYVLSGVAQLFVAKPWTEDQMRDVLERASVHHERGTRGGEAA